MSVQVRLYYILAVEGSDNFILHHTDMYCLCCTTTHTIVQLYITGHSLGGALAILFAARLHYDYIANTASSDHKDEVDSTSDSTPPAEAAVPAIHGVHTFGSPRVGDKVRTSIYAYMLYSFF
jgi:putative lipase involved disintegration of autophagic bodies